MNRPFLAHVARAALALSAALALAFGAFAPLAQAQQEPDADPPGRVARVAAFDGQVWLYSPEAGDWIGAVRNQPLTSGDRIATDTGARAELQIGSTSVRLDGATELEVVQLDDDHVELALVEGSAIARVRDLTNAGQLELSTDEGRFITLRAGSYRFDRADGKSAVTVYAGQARYEGSNSALAVNAGQRAEFWIDSGGVAQYSTLSPVNDAFTAWNNDRDRRFSGTVAERYVSPEMTGAAELDAYGRWEQTPDYGSVWIPTAVAVDWAPYSHGHWTWVRPWGWTWIDDAPWGFAPFHYGRWVHLRNNWCWTPGTRVVRPVYAPALVAWVGAPRGGVSVTIGAGPSVGWFPLAPREVYVPSYRVSSRYARNVNITNVSSVTVITNVFSNPQAPREFHNRSAPRALTVVPAGVVTERRAVAPAAAQFRQTPWVRELANQPGRTTALLAPPVAAPAAPARHPDPSNVRPPPGQADRPGFAGRPGAPGRDRNEADRDRDRDRRGPPPRDAQRATDAVPRAQAPDARPALPAAQPAQPTAPMAAQPAAPTAAPERAQIGAPPRPVTDTGELRRRGFDNDNPGGRPDQRPSAGQRGGERRDGIERPPRAAQAQPAPAQPVAPPAQPVVAPAQPVAAPPAPVQPAAPIARPAPQAVAPPVVQPVRPATVPSPEGQGPNMRPFPVRRGDERANEDRRGPRPESAEQRAPAPRVEAPRPAAAPQPQPVAPPPRPVEMQRPAPAPAPAAVAPPPARPADVQRPAPVAAPPTRPVEVQRPEPQRPESPRGGDDKRGGGPRDRDRDQR